MAHLYQVASKGDTVPGFWIKHSLSLRGGPALLPETPNPSSSLGAPDGNCTGYPSSSPTLTLQHLPPALSRPSAPTPRPQARKPPGPTHPARAHSHTQTLQRSWHPRSPPAADGGPQLGLRAGKAESRCRCRQRYCCSPRRPAPRNRRCLSRKHQTLRPLCPAKLAAAAGPPSYGERP